MYIYDYGSITNIANPNTPFHLYHWLSVGSVMTIRTLAGCKCRHTLRANILGRACFFSQWRLVRTVPLANMLFGAKNANTHSICGGSIAAFTKRRHDPWNWHTVDRLHFGHITKYLQQISVYWPKWQNIAVEHVGNTQRATYSSTIMRDTIRGRPLCLAPSSIFASGPAQRIIIKGIK